MSQKKKASERRGNLQYLAGDVRIDVARGKGAGKDYEYDYPHPLLDWQKNLVIGEWVRMKPTWRCSIPWAKECLMKVYFIYNWGVEGYAALGPGNKIQTYLIHAYWDDFLPLNINDPLGYHWAPDDWLNRHSRVDARNKVGFRKGIKRVSNYKRIGEDKPK